MRRLWPILLIAGACRSPAPRWPEPLCPGPRCDWSPLARLADSAVTDSAAPGLVVAVSARGTRWYYGAGQLAWNDPTHPGPSTVYDLASLTKVVGLTTAAMLAVDDGRLDLDAPLDRYLPGAAAGPIVTIRQLLTHTSGLPPFRRLWLESPGRDSALALVMATVPDTAPGARTVYSDIGAMLLGKAVERIYGERLDTLLSGRVFTPLGMRSTRFLPPGEWIGRIAPTEADAWRGRIVRGEVHDENAHWLGGVSGHAGLFGSAEDLLAFGEWLLSGLGPAPGSNGPSVQSGPRPPASLPMFVQRQNLVPGSSRALGWDTPSEGSSAGTVLSPDSFGHTGFTGTSVWIDPGRGLVVVLLSNRVHPTRENLRLGRLRPLVADMAGRLVAPRSPLTPERPN